MCVAGKGVYILWVVCGCLWYGGCRYNIYGVCIDIWGVGCRCVQCGLRIDVCSVRRINMCIVWGRCVYVWGVCVAL